MCLLHGRGKYKGPAQKNRGTDGKKNLEPKQERKIKEMRKETVFLYRLGNQRPMALPLIHSDEYETENLSRVRHRLSRQI